MSCCTNTYNLGCHYHCNQLKFGSSTFTGEVTGMFSSASGVVPQVINVTTSGQFIFDLSYLNESSDYTLKIYNDGELVSLTIDETDYDCFSLKTEISGIAVSFVPVPVVDNEVSVLTFTATGVDTYTNSELIDKTLLLVFTDNAIRIPTDYTFTSSTGIIVFISPIDTDTIIQIVYK